MDPLTALQAKAADQADSNLGPVPEERLSVSPTRHGIHVDFFGDPFGELYEELIGVLSQPEVASELLSLSLRGPDEGANGTRNWNLSGLIVDQVQYPRLRSLLIEQTRPADHNRSIVAVDDDEDGVLAQVLARSPALEWLVSPSAPSAAFFEVGPRPLRLLSVDAGYDHQNFLRNLARSRCFPDLAAFEFGEYAETYMADYLDRVTPVDDYEALFASPALARVPAFVWRNPACDATEITRLKRQFPQRQILVVRWSAEWIRS